jgi:hypothetical protein
MSSLVWRVRGRHLEKVTVGEIWRLASPGSGTYVSDGGAGPATSESLRAPTPRSRPSGARSTIGAGVRTKSQKNQIVKAS